MFLSKSFVVSGLTLRSLIHFEFIFVYVFGKCSNFILLHVAVQFSQHPLLKRLSLPHCVFLHPFSKGGAWVYIWAFYLGPWVYISFLCQYHSILMTVALKYNLKSERLIPPVAFFVLKTALVIRGLLCFHVNCEVFCSGSAKNAVVI